MPFEVASLDQHHFFLPLIGVALNFTPSCRSIKHFQLFSPLFTTLILIDNHLSVQIPAGISVNQRLKLID